MREAGLGAAPGQGSGIGTKPGKARPVRAPGRLGHLREGQQQMPGKFAPENFRKELLNPGGERGVDPGAQRRHGPDAARTDLTEREML